MASRSEEKFIDQVLGTGSGLKQEVIGHSPGVLLRCLRKRLRMTQQQLAKRTGFPQSYIASIESGRKNPPMQTLEKISKALYCSFTFLLIPELDVNELLENQAKRAASKRVRYVAGTMALEKQLPGKTVLQEMIDEETQKLLNSKTTKIWD